MTVRIAVLDASIGDTPAERNLRRELDAEITVYKASEGVFPPAVSARDWRYDGVVISGSQTSVYDDHDWIHEATEWARRVHASDVPMLGICWGHQFLAQALGGRVADMGEYEIGYREISRVGEDPLLVDLSETFTSFETHADRVTELPPGAVTLARNDVGLQAFRAGSAWGVQFHPEYDRQTAEWVIRGKDLPEKRVESLLDGVTEEAVTAAADAKVVFKNFVQFTANHQPKVYGRRKKKRQHCE